MLQGSETADSTSGSGYESDELRPLGLSKGIHGFYRKLSDGHAECKSEQKLEELVLHRLPGEKMGMVLGIERFGEKVSKVCVRRVSVGGAAQRATGSSRGICDGDELLAINGVELNQLSHSECLDVFRGMPLQVNVVVKRSGFHGLNRNKHVSRMNNSVKPGTDSKLDEKNSTKCSDSGFKIPKQIPPSDDKTFNRYSFREDSLRSSLKKHNFGHALKSTSSSNNSNSLTDRGKSETSKMANIVYTPLRRNSLESVNRPKIRDLILKRDSAAHGAGQTVVPQLLWQPDPSNEPSLDAILRECGLVSLPDGFSLHRVRITKGADEPLGLSIVPSYGTTKLFYQIKRLLPSGACCRDNQLHIGDRILYVNGISLRGVTQQQCMTLFREAAEVVNFVIFRLQHDDTALQIHVTNKNSPAVSIRSNNKRSNLSGRILSAASLSDSLSGGSAASSSSESGLVEQTDRDYLWSSDASSDETLDSGSDTKLSHSNNSNNFYRIPDHIRRTKGLSKNSRVLNEVIPAKYTNDHCDTNFLSSDKINKYSLKMESSSRQEFEESRIPLKPKQNFNNNVDSSCFYSEPVTNSVNNDSVDINVNSNNEISSISLNPMMTFCDDAWTSLTCQSAEDVAVPITNIDDLLFDDDDHNTITCQTSEVDLNPQIPKDIKDSKSQMEFNYTNEEIQLRVDDSGSNTSEYSNANSKEKAQELSDDRCNKHLFDLYQQSRLDAPFYEVPDRHFENEDQNEGSLISVNGQSNEDKQLLSEHQNSSPFSFDSGLTFCNSDPDTVTEEKIGDFKSDSVIGEHVTKLSVLPDADGKFTTDGTVKHISMITLSGEQSVEIDPSLKGDLLKPNMVNTQQRNQTSTAAVPSDIRVKSMSLDRRAVGRSAQPSHLASLSGLNLHESSKKPYAVVSLYKRSEQGPFQIDVLKGVLGLGIRIQISPEGFPVVTELQRGSPIANNGNIAIGDFILSLNATDITRMSESKIQQIVRLLPRGLVKVVASVTPPDQLLAKDTRVDFAHIDEPLTDEPKVTTALMEDSQTEYTPNSSTASQIESCMEISDSSLSKQNEPILSNDTPSTNESDSLMDMLCGPLTANNDRGENVLEKLDVVDNHDVVDNLTGCSLGPNMFNTTEDISQKPMENTTSNADNYHAKHGNVSQLSGSQTVAVESCEKLDPIIISSGMPNQDFPECIDLMHPAEVILQDSEATVPNLVAASDLEQNCELWNSTQVILKEYDRPNTENSSSNSVSVDDVILLDKEGDKSTMKDQDGLVWEQTDFVQNSNCLSSRGEEKLTCTSMRDECHVDGNVSGEIEIVTTAGSQNNISEGSTGDVIEQLVSSEMEYHERMSENVVAENIASEIMSEVIDGDNDSGPVENVVADQIVDEMLYDRQTIYEISREENANNGILITTTADGKENSVSCIIADEMGTTGIYEKCNAEAVKNSICQESENIVTGLILDDLVPEGEGQIINASIDKRPNEQTSDNIVANMMAEDILMDKAHHSANTGAEVQESICNNVNNAYQNGNVSFENGKSENIVAELIVDDMHSHGLYQAVKLCRGSDQEENISMEDSLQRQSNDTHIINLSNMYVNDILEQAVAQLQLERNLIRENGDNVDEDIYKSTINQDDDEDEGGNDSKEELTLITDIIKDQTLDLVPDQEVDLKIQGSVLLTPEYGDDDTILYENMTSEAKADSGDAFIADSSPESLSVRNEIVQDDNKKEMDFDCQDEKPKSDDANNMKWLNKKPPMTRQFSDKLDVFTKNSNSQVVKPNTDNIGKRSVLARVTNFENTDVTTSYSRSSERRRNEGDQLLWHEEGGNKRKLHDKVSNFQSPGGSAIFSRSAERRQELEAHLYGDNNMTPKNGNAKKRVLSAVTSFEQSETPSYNFAAERTKAIEAKTVSNKLQTLQKEKEKIVSPITLSIDSHVKDKVCDFEVENKFAVSHPNLTLKSDVMSKVKSFEDPSEMSQSGTSRLPRQTAIDHNHSLEKKVSPVNVIPPPIAMKPRSRPRNLLSDSSGDFYRDSKDTKEHLTSVYSEFENLQVFDGSHNTKTTLERTQSLDSFKQDHTDGPTADTNTNPSDDSNNTFDNITPVPYKRRLQDIISEKKMKSVDVRKLTLPSPSTKLPWFPKSYTSVSTKPLTKALTLNSLPVTDLKVTNTNVNTDDSKKLQTSKLSSALRPRNTSGGSSTSSLSPTSPKMSNTFQHRVTSRSPEIEQKMFKFAHFPSADSVEKLEKDYNIEIINKNNDEKHGKNEEVEKLSKFDDGEKCSINVEVAKFGKNEEVEKLNKNVEPENLNEKDQSEKLSMCDKYYKNEVELFKNIEVEQLGKYNKVENLNKNEENVQLSARDEAYKHSKNDEVEELSKNDEFEKLSNNEVEELSKNDGDKLSENDEVEKLSKNDEFEKLSNNEVEELSKNDGDQLSENDEVEKLSKNNEVEKLSKNNEVEKLSKNNEVEEFSKNNEVEEFSKIDEGEKLSKVDEGEKLSKIDEGEKLSEVDEGEKLKIDEGEKLSKVDEGEKLSKVDEGEKLEKIDEVEKLSKIDEAEKVSEINEAEKFSEIDVDKLGKSKDDNVVEKCCNNELSVEGNISHIDLDINSNAKTKSAQVGDVKNVMVDNAFVNNLIDLNFYDATEDYNVNNNNKPDVIEGILFHAHEVKVQKNFSIESEARQDELIMQSEGCHDFLEMNAIAEDNQIKFTTEYDQPGIEFERSKVGQMKSRGTCEVVDSANINEKSCLDNNLINMDAFSVNEIIAKSSPDILQSHNDFVYNSVAQDVLNEAPPTGNLSNAHHEKLDDLYNAINVSPDTSDCMEAKVHESNQSIASIDSGIFQLCSVEKSPEIGADTTSVLSALDISSVSMLSDVSYKAPVSQSVTNLNLVDDFSADQSVLSLTQESDNSMISLEEMEMVEKVDNMETCGTIGKMTGSDKHLLQPNNQTQFEVPTFDNLSIKSKSDISMNNHLPENQPYNNQVQSSLVTNGSNFLFQTTSEITFIDGNCNETAKKNSDDKFPLTSLSDKNSAFVSIKSPRQWSVYSNQKCLGQGARDDTVNVEPHLSPTLSSAYLSTLITSANEILKGKSPEKHDIIIVTLVRGLDEKVGLTLKTTGGNLLVYAVDPDSTVGRNNRIFRDDHLLLINGESTNGMSPSVARSRMRLSKGHLDLVAARSSQSNPVVSGTVKSSETSSDFVTSSGALPNVTPEGGIIEVVMEKGVTGLGFCIEGGSDSPLGHRPITVKRLFKGGAADKSGKLRVGDEIHSINGTSLMNHRHYEAWNMIRFAPDGPLHLLIKRF